MEERIIDDPRKIKVKRNAVGGIEDATDALAEEELSLEMPEEDELPEELDEDLIGLAPSELERELARRKREAEKVAAERDKMLAAGKEALEKEGYAEAAPYFSQAIALDPTCTEAEKLYFSCKTEGYSNADLLVEEDAARELADSSAEAKEYVRQQLGEVWRAGKKEAEEKAAPLRERVYAALEKRREAFRANRKYYTVRLLSCICALLVLAIASGICATFIVRTTGILPAVLTAVLGGLALLSLIPIVIFARKWFVAHKLCTDNEKLSSTEEGEALEELETLISIYSLLLEG